MRDGIFITDSQVHCYEMDTPERPWQGFLQGPKHATGEDMVKAMDDVGVDRALLISPSSLYGYDASYALEVYAKYPDRFALIKPFDPLSMEVSDEIDIWAKKKGVVGARLQLGREPLESSIQGFHTIVAAGGRAGIPVNVQCAANLHIFRELAERNPNTQLVIDHVGMLQPHIPPVPKVPFGDLENVLSLAKYENVAIKISGACTLSHMPYPYQDIWQPLSQIFEEYGVERCMWGTDWTRAVNFLNYEEGVSAFLNTDVISGSDRVELMGGTLAKIYKWSSDNVQ